MHGVDRPEPFDLVQGAVDRILDEIGKDDRHDELNGPRQRRHESLDAAVDRPGKEGRRRHRRRKGEDPDQQMIERKVTEIVPPIRAQDGLLANVRKQLLEENKDHRRQEEVEDKPIDADIPRDVVARPDLHRHAAAPQRKEGERDADGTHQLFAVQDEGDEPERNRKDHPGIEQVTHLVRGVDLAQLRRRHQVREMKAQDTQHTEDTQRH